MLHIHYCSPAQYTGWISDKEHIVQHQPSTNELEEGARIAEILRRDRVRSQRAAQRSAAAAAAATAAAANATSAATTLTATAEGTLELSGSTMFLLDRSSAGSGVSLSADCATASCEGGSGRCMVLGTRGYRAGVHYWEVCTAAHYYHLLLVLYYTLPT
jgi:hypothetical protein